MTTPLSFNANWYLSQNPDVAAAIQAGAPFNAFEHFQLYGRVEGRSASPLFDPQEYLAANPDVAEAVAQGLITAWDHFELFGGDEGRSPTPLFNEAFYLQQNPDVAAAIEQGIISSAAQHFALFGANEPRAINPVINLGQYINANPDIAEAASNGLIDAFQHLLQFGVNEGRPLGNGVSLSDFSADPGFSPGTQGGVQALLRVEAVAPFLPTFERPAGWTPPSNTPIPVDFVPPAGSGLKLQVPAEVVVPDDVDLPDVFDPVEPEPDTGGGGGGGEDNDDNDPTFTVTESQAGVVTFTEGSGDIEISITDGTATFERGGQTATTTVTSITTKTIDLAEGQTLAINSAEMTALAGVTLTGAGALKVTEPVTIEQLNNFGDQTGFTGTATFSIEDNPSHLAAANDVALEAATAITVTDAATVAQMSAIVTNGADLSTTTYTISDTAAAIAAVADWTAFANATNVAATTAELDVATATTLEGFVTNGDVDAATYTISATATEVLGLDLTNFPNATAIVATSEELGLTQATTLETLIADSQGIVTGAYTISDTAVAIAAVADWTAFANATSVVATTAELDVATATTLEGFVTDGDVNSATYTVSDTILAANGLNFTISYTGNTGVTLTGSAGSQTVTGSAFDDTIDGGDDADTITGGAGADQITTGLGADVLVLAASGDSAAGTVSGGTLLSNIVEGAGDVVTGDISDTFDLVLGGGTYNATSFTVHSDIENIADVVGAGLDVFVYQDIGTNKLHLLYETTDGGENDLGSFETVELVGIVGSTDAFSVTAAGVVSFNVGP